MKKKLLVVVDMQNDFVIGALKNDAAKAIIPTIAEVIDKWDGDIAFTRDTHQENYMETQEGKNLPVPHCIEGTKGWEIVPEFAKYMPNPKGQYETEDNFIGIGYDYICDNGTMIINKPVFGSIELAELAREREYEEVVLVGTCTGICVINNASVVRTFAPETKVTVIANACACLNDETNKIALEAMKLFQVNVI